MTRARGERRTRGRNRWYVLGTAAALVALLGIGIWRANPPLPPTPELEGISLELEAPAAAPSALLTELLARPPRPGLFQGDAALERARRRVEGGEWIDEPDRVRAALDGLREPTLDAMRAALRAPGCLPVRSLLVTTEPRLNYLHLLAAVRLLVLDSVATCQQGRPGQAARQLTWLSRRLSRMERGCNAHLLGTAALVASVDATLAGMAHLLAHPALDSGERADLFRRLRALERRASPMASACRREAEVMRAAVEQVMGGEHGRSKPWPLFDREQTLALNELQARRCVWLARLPLESRAWRGPFPEQRYFEELRDGSGWLALLRYNGAGKALLGIVTTVQRSQILRWHRSACMAAARRALWSRQLRQRGIAVPAPAASPPARDRFAGREFGSITPADEVCAFAPRHAPGGGVTTPSLPPPPPGGALDAR